MDLFLNQNYKPVYLLDRTNCTHVPDTIHHSKVVAMLELDIFEST